MPVPLKRGDPPVSVKKQQKEAEKQKQQRQAEEQKRKNAKAKTSGKRRGPLPLWLAEIGVLGSFGGIAALALSAGKGGKGDWRGKAPMPFQPGATPQVIEGEMTRAESPFHRSVPYIPFIVCHPVFCEKRPIFVLESPRSMMVLLIVNVE